MSTPAAPATEAQILAAAIRRSIGTGQETPGQMAERILADPVYRREATQQAAGLTDPYDMRVMVRALYASGLTDDMNPSERRQAAVRLRDAMREWSARLASLDEDSP